jgi:hypothetical protein
MKEFIEKLIGRLEEEKQRLRKLKNDTIALSDSEVIAIEEGAYNFCKNIVNQLAEEYRQDLDKNSQGWIPTSERLPEKNAIVLTCDKDGWISVKVNMPYAGAKNDFECGYYVAWMPLPPAYVPKEGRE